MTETTTTTELVTNLYDMAREYERIAREYWLCAERHVIAAGRVHDSDSYTCIRRDEIIHEINAAVDCISSAYPLYSQALCNWNTLQGIWTKDLDGFADAFVDYVDPRIELINLDYEGCVARLDDLSKEASELRRAALDLC